MIFRLRAPCCRHTPPPAIHHAWSLQTHLQAGRGPRHPGSLQRARRPRCSQSQPWEQTEPDKKDGTGHDRACCGSRDFPGSRNFTLTVFGNSAAAKPARPPPPPQRADSSVWCWSSAPPTPGRHRALLGGSAGRQPAEQRSEALGHFTSLSLGGHVWKKGVNADLTGSREDR